MNGIMNSIANYKRKLTSTEDNLFRDNLVCKLTGVTFEDRQDALKEVISTTKLKLDRERNNPYDFNAVKVKGFINSDWKDLGYIPKEVNESVANALDKGVKLKVHYKERLGDPEIGYNYGLMVVVNRR